MTSRLTLAARGQDGKLYTIAQTAPSGSWTTWHSLGGPPGGSLSVPTLAANADGRLEVFAGGAVGNTPGLWHCAQTARYGGWGSWIRVPDPAGVSWTEVGVAVRPGQDGRLELFAANGEDRQPPLNAAANDVWHRWQTARSNGWSGWQSASQPPDAQQLGLILASNNDATLDLVASVATPGAATEEFHYWHLAQLTPNGNWGAWAQLPDAPDPHQPLSGGVIGRNQDGRLELFAIQNATRSLLHTWQHTPGGAWAAWFSSGRPAGRQATGYGLAVGRNADGRLELFTTAAVDPFSDAQEVWHIWQTTPNGSWSQWASLGQPGGGVGTEGQELAVAPSDDGRLELFSACRDGSLRHCWQTTPNGTWSAWFNHGTPPATASVSFPSLCAS